MTLSFDLADDLAHLDGLETVTVYAPDAESGVTLAGALRRRPTQREQEASDGRYLADDVRWHLPAAGLSAPPLPGARIIDATGQRWTVLEVERVALGTRYVCLCRNLAISGGLDQTVTLQRATWTKDAAGAPVAAWRDMRIGLRARLQPIDGAAEHARDQPTTRRRYRVYLEERLSIDQDCRIIHDGRAYRVTGYELPARIDCLMAVLVEAE